MLRAIQEPLHIDIFHKYKEDTALTGVITAGRVVMKTGPDTVEVSDGTAVWGLLSQDVFPTPLQRTFQPFLNHQAYDGDPVGVYTTPGVFRTDQFVAGDYKDVDALYVTGEGKLTGEEGAPDAKKGNIQVGRLIKDEGGTLLFQFNGQTNTIVVEAPSGD